MFEIWDASWRRSGRSGGTNCVEVAWAGRTVLVRDSKDPEGALLRVGGPAWSRLVKALKGSGHA